MLPPELLFFFFLMIRRPPRSTLFPTRRSSDLTFWNVREHSLADIWDNSPAFMAFRGTDWMQEPCRSCPKRSEEHTSELQSQSNLVCRLLLEKKKTNDTLTPPRDRGSHSIRRPT